MKLMQRNTLDIAKILSKVPHPSSPIPPIRRISPIPPSRHIFLAHIVDGAKEPGLSVIGTAVEFDAIPGR